MDTEQIRAAMLYFRVRLADGEQTVTGEYVSKRADDHLRTVLDAIDELLPGIAAPRPRPSWKKTVATLHRLSEELRDEPQ